MLIRYFMYMGGCPADLLTNQAVLDSRVHDHTSRAPPVVMYNALYIRYIMYNDLGYSTCAVLAVLQESSSDVYYVD
jgi:hypothetical protein